MKKSWPQMTVTTETGDLAALDRGVRRSSRSVWRWGACAASGPRPQPIKEQCVHVNEVFISLCVVPTFKYKILVRP